MSVEGLFVPHEDLGVVREVAIGPVQALFGLVEALTDDIEFGQQRPVDGDLAAEERPEELAKATPKDPPARGKTDVGVRLGLQPVRTRTRHDRLLERGGEPDKQPRCRLRSYWPSDAGVLFMHRNIGVGTGVLDAPIPADCGLDGPSTCSSRSGSLRQIYAKHGTRRRKTGRTADRSSALTRLCREEAAERDDLEIAGDGHVLANTRSHPLLVGIERVRRG